MEQLKPVYGVCLAIGTEGLRFLDCFYLLKTSFCGVNSFEVFGDLSEQEKLFLSEWGRRFSININIYSLAEIVGPVLDQTDQRVNPKILSLLEKGCLDSLFYYFEDIKRGLSDQIESERSNSVWCEFNRSKLDHFRGVEIRKKTARLLIKHIVSQNVSDDFCAEEISKWEYQGRWTDS